MQSLALDVGVVSEEGQHTELRDEDDDLLRAAEELGIDLSGVRAPTGEVNGVAPEGDGEVVEAEQGVEDSSVEPIDADAGTDDEDDDIEVAIDVEELIVDGIGLDPLDGVEDAPTEEPVEETET
jgi:DNA-directed RNA polymerase subunit beta